MKSILTHKKYSIDFMLIEILMALIFLSIFNQINVGIHIVIFVLIVFLSSNYIPIKQIIPILIIDLVVGVMFISAGNYGTGFNDPLINFLKFYNYTQAYTIYLIMCNMDLQLKKVVLESIIFCVVVTALISMFYNVFVSDIAIRFRPPEMKFICTFGQYYVTMFIIAALSCKLLREQEYAVNRTLIIIIGIVLLLLNIIGNLVTGLVLCVCGILFALVFTRTKNIKKSIVLVILIFLLGLMFKSWIAFVVYRISDLGIFNEITSNKIEAIGNILIGNGQVDTLNSREKLSEFSMNSFYNSPYIGIGYKNYKFGTVGCHQEWSDFLAVFGIIGSLIFLLVIIKNSINIYKHLDDQVDKDSFIIALILLIMFGFFNPALMEETLIGVFVVAPNISLIFNERNLSKI